MNRTTIVETMALARPLAKRLLETSARQLKDLGKLTELLLHVEAALQSDAHFTDAGRTTRDLMMAAVRAGVTVAGLAHMTGIDAARIDAIAKGATPTSTERERLRGALPDWRG